MIRYLKMPSVKTLFEHCKNKGIIHLNDHSMIRDGKLPKIVEAFQEISVFLTKWAYAPE